MRAPILWVAALALTVAWAGGAGSVGGVVFAQGMALTAISGSCATTGPAVLAINVAEGVGSLVTGSGCGGWRDVFTVGICTGSDPGPIVCERAVEPYRMRMTLGADGALDYHVDVQHSFAVDVTGQLARV